MTPGSGKLKVAVSVALFGAGVGGAYVIEGIRKLRKRRQIQSEQDVWREKSEEMRAEKEQNKSGDEKRPGNDHQPFGKTG